MSGYTSLVKKQYTFEGDTVEVQFRRMKRKHMLKLIPVMNEYNEALEVEETGGEAPKPSSELVENLLTVVMGHATEYVSYLTGLKDSEGADVGITEVFEEMYFLELATEIAEDLMEESLGPLAKMPDSSGESPKES
jgi:hypothetical protein